MLKGRQVERLVHFTLFGQEFSFYTDASEEDVGQVLDIVRSELDAEGGPAARTSVPSSKVLVLGCLRIAARYVQLASEYDSFRRKQDNSIDHLINKVSSGID